MRAATVVALRDQLPLLAWLVLVWTALWGTWTLANIITGTLVAVAVTTVLPLPPVTLGGRVHPWGLVLLVGHFVVDLVKASAQVAWLAMRPGPPPHSAVVAVRLRSSSDLILTITSQVLSLVPGGLIVEVDREEATLYVHVLDVNSAADIEAFRAGVLALELRVVSALGPSRMLAELRTERTAP